MNKLQDTLLEVVNSNPKPSEDAYKSPSPTLPIIKREDDEDASEKKNQQPGPTPFVADNSWINDPNAGGEIPALENENGDVAASQEQKENDQEQNTDDNDLQGPKRKKQKLNDGSSN